VTKSPAVFDFQKLEWLNGEHLRALAPDAYAAALLEHLRDSGSPLADEPERVTEAAAMVQDKLRELGDFEDFAGFLFRPVRMDPEAWAKVEKDADAPRSLDAAERRPRGVVPAARRRC